MSAALLNVRAVVSKIGLSKSRIYELVRHGEFPRPRRVEGRTVWLEALVDAWREENATAERMRVCNHPRAESPTSLYRHFAADGTLLYVGIAINCFNRNSDHEKNAPWFKDVVRIELEWFPTRLAAMKAESIAINTESPRHNQRGFFR